ncbi:zinc finger, CCHC-type containing protein, partial [Tanacetum coccineum]
GMKNNHKKKKNDNVLGDASVEPRDKVNDEITSISTAGTSSLTKRGSEVGDESVMKKIPASDANKLSPTSLTKDNLRKINATVLNDADYDAWLPLDLVHEFSSTEGVDSVLRDSPWMIREVHIFLNKWSPSLSLLKENLSRVPAWVKFRDVSLVAYTSDGLSLIATKSCDNLVMAMPNLEGTGYTKETIRVEYEWKPPRCKGGSSGVKDEAFVEVKKKKSGGNNGGNKNFKPVSLKPKPQCRPKAKQSTEGVNQKMTISVGKKNVSTSEGQNSTPLVEKINMFEKQLLEGECVLVDDDGKPLKKANYSDDQDSEDEIESVDNEMASYLASKSSRVEYGTKSLLEQWRETYVNDDYNPYDNDMYEGQDIPGNI